jgi:hypothetical protein
LWRAPQRVASNSDGVLDVGSSLTEVCGVEAEELAKRLEAAAEEMSQVMKRYGADRPDWDPLEKVLPLEHCAGFMFMGYSGAIRLYKHGFTRHYLNVDPDGHTYWYNERLDSYYRIAKELAIEYVFEGLEEAGVKRSTPYDAKARRKKDEALKEAGWTMVRATPDGVRVVGKD